MTTLKTEITTLKQQHAADQYEIRTKDDRIDQLIREIRNLVGFSVYFEFNLRRDSILTMRFSVRVGRKMWRFRGGGDPNRAYAGGYRGAGIRVTRHRACRDSGCREPGRRRQTGNPAYPPVAQWTDPAEIAEEKHAKHYTSVGRKYYKRGTSGSAEVSINDTRVTGARSHDIS